MPIANLNRLDYLIIQLFLILLVIVMYGLAVVGVVFYGYQVAGPIAFYLPLIRLGYIVAYDRPERETYGLSRSPAKNQ